MKVLTMTVLVGLALASVTPSFAGPVFQVQITGATQGKFRGEGSGEKTGFFPGLHMDFEVKSPRDPASGMPSGKRSYSPLVVTKEWGASSTQIFRALTTNEVLRTVVLNFYRAATGTGEMVVSETWTLTDATVAAVKAYENSAVKESNLEDVSFTFRRIEIFNHETKDVFVDDVRQ